MFILLHVNAYLGTGENEENLNNCWVIGAINLKYVILHLIRLNSHYSIERNLKSRTIGSKVTFFLQLAMFRF